MNYEIERNQDIGGEPSLVEMTEKAIQILEKNGKGFFLLVEGMCSCLYLIDNLLK